LNGTFESIQPLNLLPRWIACAVFLAHALPLVGSGCGHSPVRNSKLSQTHYLLGEDYFRKKQPDESRRELLQALALDDENEEANQLLGVISFLEGLHRVNEIEIDHCLKGEEAQEQREEAKKEFLKSESYFQRAIGLAEKEKKIESEALNYLANIALYLKRYDEAIALGKRALENITFTQQHLPLSALGWAYYQKGEKARAARELRQAIFHDPQFSLGRFRLAKVYYDEQKYDKVIEELTQVTKDENCPLQEAFQLLGLAYLKKRQPEEAHIQFERCLKISPKSCISEECRRYSKLM
jgi:type IV pilus assembly protein PilF